MRISREYKQSNCFDDLEGTGVRQVQITINGESNAKYMEKVDLSQPLNEEQDWIAADNKE